ncbi:MAG: hypothetical protein AAF387_11670 [Pseudomonadota bacterium]
MSLNFTIDYLQRHEYLTAQRDFTLDILTQLSSGLLALELVQEYVETIFAAGSLGRLEANSMSDADCIVILNQSVGASIQQQLMRDVEKCYDDVGLRRAKSTGIYSHPVQSNELLANAGRGSLNDSPAIYGKRIQTLLDARPVINEAAFQRLQMRVLDWFNPEISTAGLRYEFLLNEIRRYLAAYASWQYFKFDRDEDDGWLLRQAKLGLTRRTTVAALALVIGTINDANKDVEIGHFMPLAPLKRIVSIFELYGEFDLRAEYVECYERANQLLHDTRVRAELIVKSPAALPLRRAELPASFLQLEQDADRLRAMLILFAQRRQVDWPTAWYSGLLA